MVAFLPCHLAIPQLIGFHSLGFKCGISCDVQTDQYKKDKDMLPMPGDLLGSYEASYQGSERLECLRETEAYAEFLYMFVKSVVMCADFKENSTHKLLSEYMTPNLEAFAVLTYVNNYEQWVEASVYASMTVDQRAMAGQPNAKRRYTSKTRGCGKYNGWSAEGIKLYYDLTDEIIKQRKGPDLATFEEGLQKLFKAEKTTNAGGSGRGDEENGKMCHVLCLGIFWNRKMVLVRDRGGMVLIWTLSIERLMLGMVDR